MSAYRPGNMRGPGEMTPLLLLLLLTSLAGTVLCQSEYEDEPDEAPEEVPDEASYEVIDEVPDEVTDEVTEDEIPELDSAPDDGIPTTVPPIVSDDTSSTSDTPPSQVSPSTTVEEHIEGELGSGEDLIDSINNYEAGVDVSPVSDPTASPVDSIDPTVILIPVGLVVVIIAMIVCGILVNRRWNQKMRGTDQRKEDPYLDGCGTEKVPMPMFEEDVPSVLELEMEELDQWMSNDGEAAKNSEHT